LAIKSLELEVVSEKQMTVVRLWLEQILYG